MKTIKSLNFFVVNYLFQPILNILWKIFGISTPIVLLVTIIFSVLLEMNVLSLFGENDSLVFFLYIVATLYAIYILVQLVTYANRTEKGVMESRLETLLFRNNKLDKDFPNITFFFSAGLIVASIISTVLDLYFQSKINLQAVSTIFCLLPYCLLHCRLPRAK